MRIINSIVCFLALNILLMGSVLAVSAIPNLGENDYTNFTVSKNQLLEDFLWTYYYVCDSYQKDCSSPSANLSEFYRSFVVAMQPNIWRKDIPKLQKRKLANKDIILEQIITHELILVPKFWPNSFMLDWDGRIQIASHPEQLDQSFTIEPIESTHDTLKIKIKATSTSYLFVTVTSGDYSETLSRPPTPTAKSFTFVLKNQNKPIKLDFKESSTKDSTIVEPIDIYSINLKTL